MRVLEQGRRRPRVTVNVPEPHSGQRWFLRLVLRWSQMVSCESAGKPVQPTWRSGNCYLVSYCNSKQLAGGDRGWAGMMTHVGEDLNGLVEGANTVGLEGGHVEDVDALDLTEELEALDTGSLLLAARVSALGSLLVWRWLSGPLRISKWPPIVPPSDRLERPAASPSSAAREMVVSRMRVRTLWGSGQPGRLHLSRRQRMSSH